VVVVELNDEDIIGGINGYGIPYGEGIPPIIPGICIPGIIPGVWGIKGIIPGGYIPGIIPGIYICIYGGICGGIPYIPGY